MEGSCGFERVSEVMKDVPEALDWLRHEVEEEDGRWRTKQGQMHRMLCQMAK